MNRRGQNRALWNTALYVIDVETCTINDSSTGKYVSNEGDHSTYSSDAI